MPCTRHRVFLATLIVAAKYLNDSSPKNKHWASYAALFATEEVNLMEKQLLYLLDYDLRFSEKEACKTFAPFMVTSLSFTYKSTATTDEQSRRSAAIEKVSKASKARAQANAPISPPATDREVDGLPSTGVVSAVRNMVKRISPGHHNVVENGFLATSRSTSSASSSISSSDSASSLLEDHGASSSASSTYDSDDGIKEVPRVDIDLRFPKRGSSQIRRQGRKPSETSSVNSMSTIRGEDSASPKISNRHSKAGASYPLRNNFCTNSDAPRSKDGGTGFLSRIWVAATTNHKATSSCDSVSASGSSGNNALDSSTSGTFRRLVPSKSGTVRDRLLCDI